MSHPLSTGFFGSGYFAADCLRLIAEKNKPSWVITNAPKQAGRGMKERLTPVHSAACELGLPLYTTGRIARDEARLGWIKDNLPDVLLVIDFGQMIREPLLSMARLGCLNIHPSLLPAYRGSAPVQRAIMDGLKLTGVTVFQLDVGMDSGPVLARREVKIEAGDDSGAVLKKCAVVGGGLLLKFLYEIPEPKWDFTPQSEKGASLAPKIDKSEEQINWNETARSIADKVRALSPSPMAYATILGKRLKITRASCRSGGGTPAALVGTAEGLPLIACGDGLLLLERVQPENRGEMSAADWLRGARLRIGEPIS